MTPETSPSRPRVVIAGGGVGALEAAMALRSLAGQNVNIDLIAPGSDFVYRAMAVAAPFGYARSLRVSLGRLWQTHRVRHRRDAVVGVDASQRHALLASGEQIPYTELILAPGARARPWLEGALSFSGPDSVSEMEDLLARVEAGDVSSVLFTAPPGTGWTLPMYDLALLMSTWCVDHGLIGVEISLATSEPAPLAAFGQAAARTVGDLLADRGIRIHPNAQTVGYDGRRVRLSNGAALDCDAVVALPQLSGSVIAGLPSDRDGFLPVDDHAAVVGVEHVYAVGDATIHPVKQGGLATQQADVAASAVAHAIGADVEPEPFRPVLRGLVLTGVAAAYLRTDAEAGTADFDALWWPPTKVAGRHLGPYLTDVLAHGDHGDLSLAAAQVEVGHAADDRADLRRLAIKMAKADALWKDHESALRWLQTVEWLDGTLPPELSELQASWRTQLPPQTTNPSQGRLTRRA